MVNVHIENLFLKKVRGVMLPEFSLSVTAFYLSKQLQYFCVLETKIKMFF